MSAIAFSPSGRHFAVGIGRQIELWHTPSTPDSSIDGVLEFAPFVRHRVLTGHFDAVRSIEWSSDSRFLLSASRDLTARMWSLDPEEGFVPTTLGGHREGVIGAWFSQDQETVCLPSVSILNEICSCHSQIYTISQDGALFQWSFAPKPILDEEADSSDNGVDASMRWRIVKKSYFMQNNAKVNCAAFHMQSNLLVTGFSNGVFGLYQLPGFDMIHTLRYVPWRSGRSGDTDSSKHLSEQHRFCLHQQNRGMAGFRRGQTRAAACLGVAIRVIRIETAGSS